MANSRTYHEVGQQESLSKYIRRIQRYPLLRPEQERDLALSWDPAVYRRSGASEQRRQSRELSQLAEASSAAGRPLAAAVQAGAAEGHAEGALDLVRAATRER